MTDKDWIIFKTIAEEKNITRAAERLYLSQPAITYRLRAIEKEMDATLLIRTSYGVLLTPEGERFLEYAKQMLLSFAQTKEELQSMEQTVQGTLRIGVSSVFSHFKLPPILKQFVTRYPHVDISLQTGLSSRISRLLHHDEISVAILRGDYRWSETQILLDEEPLCIVSGQPILFSELPQQRRITYSTDTPLQTLIDDWWRQSFSTPFVSDMVVDSMATCRQLVSAGLGWSILPAIGLRHMENLYTHQISWPDGSPFTRRTWLHTRNAAQTFRPVKAFTEFIQEYFQIQND